MVPSKIGQTLQCKLNVEFSIQTSGHSFIW